MLYFHVLSCIVCGLCSLGLAFAKPDENSSGEKNVAENDENVAQVTP